MGKPRLHSKSQKKGYANVHKQEPEQKGKCEAGQAEGDLTLETVYAEKGTWARF